MPSEPSSRPGGRAAGSRGAAATRLACRYRRRRDSVIRSYSCPTITQRLASSKTCGASADGALARRAPAVGARAHGPPSRLARHRAARDRRAGGRGRARAAARARHLRGARARSAQAAARPLVAGRRARRRRRRGRRRCRSCSPSRRRAPSRSRAATCRSTCSRSHLVGAALARAARRTGAWERGPVEGREELRAWFAREAGGEPARPRRRRLLGRPARAGDRVPRAGRAPATRCSSRRRPTSAPSSPPAPPGCASSRSPATPTACAPTCSPRPSRAPARAWSTASRCTPTRTAPCSRPTAARAVLDAVAGAGAFLLEDDWARDLSADADPPPPLAADDADGHVVYVRSLTKSAAPGLRVAGIGARGAAGARLRAARIVDDFFVSGPLQEAALEVVSAPGWRRHRRRLRAELRARRDALARRPAPPPARSSRRRRSPPAACTCGWRCPRAPTTSRWPPPRRPRASSSSPAARGSRPRRRARSCA